MNLNGQLLAQVSGFLAPLVALAGVVIAKKFDRGAQREMYPAQIITTLQAQIDDLTAEVREAKKEASEARGEMRAAAGRERIRDNYIHELRDHISAGHQPPPPGWPEGLTK